MPINSQRIEIMRILIVIFISSVEGAELAGLFHQSLKSLGFCGR